MLATTILATTVPTTADTWHDKARAMFEHAVNIPTVLGRDRGPEIANFFADQFRTAGWPEGDIHIMPYDRTAALIVRWRAEGKAKAKPIMLMGHMDVVEAKAEDWSVTDPFKFLEKDGYYYGRGTIDMKDGDVAIVTALLKLKAAGFKPKRDIIVFFTGDEETNGHGAQLGATQWHDLLDVEYGLNADGGGGGFTSEGKPIGFYLQTAEKTFANYQFTVRNRGGHSSKPRADNAVYQLAAALLKVSTYRFEPMLNETTRAYFNARQQGEKGPLGDAMRAWLKDEHDGKAADIIEADEAEVGLTRTRCVATLVNAGHAENALPQLAQANVNCRIFPGIDPNAVREELEKVVNDPGVVITRKDTYTASLASPLRPDIMKAFADAVHAKFPSVQITPQMSTGASDARPFRVAGIPVYGTSGAWVVVPTDYRAHGRDERLPVAALDDDVNHWEHMVKSLAGK
ncbi:MAG: M20/M25/M40 family metallo-hydrolase [Rickettsiales bacterium]|nr:M20/M25/M40 family metallo-hydrolase [Rickettsiales bacterium]